VGRASLLIDSVVRKWVEMGKGLSRELSSARGSAQWFSHMDFAPPGTSEDIFYVTVGKEGML
jgi:hypothetical protein